MDDSDRFTTDSSVGVMEPDATLVTDLDDICRWLGTYRERLQQARCGDQAELAAQVTRWSARLRDRRAELA